MPHKGNNCRYMFFQQIQANLPAVITSLDSTLIKAATRDVIAVRRLDTGMY